MLMPVRRARATNPRVVSVTKEGRKAGRQRKVHMLKTSERHLCASAATLTVFLMSSKSHHLRPTHLDVLTAQNLQPRVQVSPMSMMVAVAVWPSPPPQHSPMLGQRASSHTVCSFSSRSLACRKSTMAHKMHLNSSANS